VHAASEPVDSRPTGDYTKADFTNAVLEGAFVNNANFKSAIITGAPAAAPAARFMARWRFMAEPQAGCRC
jgi:hypothetical protein